MKSLAIAYAMKKRSKLPEEEEDGEEMLEPEDKPRAAHRDMFAQGRADSHDKESKRERAIRMFKGEGAKENLPAHKEDARSLNQHGEEEEGPDGPFVDADDKHRMIEHPVENQFGEGDEDEDMVGHIMKQRQKMFAKGGMAAGPEAHMCSGGNCPHYSHGGNVKEYSEGGEVANSDLPIVDDMPAEYDDLHLRDGLKSSYTGKDSGDEIGDDRLDKDEGDLISRIMKSRAKKDRMPRPA